MNAHRRKLNFRSWHRGTKEMDIILGHFSDEFLPTANDDQVAEYEQLLVENDPDLYNWISGREAVPTDKQSNSVLMSLIGYKVQRQA